MSRTTHHILPITREPDRVPWCTVNYVLEAVNGFEEACEGLDSEDSEGSVGRGEDYVAERAERA